VGEAEAMVAAGISDVLIANEVVDPAKLARIAEVARRAAVTVAADDPAPLQTLSFEAERAGVTIGVLIDVDVLLHRGGVTSIAEALALAGSIEALPGLRLAGIMGYEGRVRLGTEGRVERIAGAYRVLADTRAALVEAGHRIDVVSAAGTSTLRESINDPNITEIQAGVYALMEPELLVMDVPFRCAAIVRGTVISRHADHFVVDVGRRVVGVEYGPPVPVGFEAIHISMSDEHSTITVAGTPPPLGRTLDFIPGQIRTTFNLHDRVWVSSRGKLVDCWPVSARGASQ
jgi:D-serine deaminase-like pyridoxal phosphate-dependent protein